MRLPPARFWIAACWLLASAGGARAQQGAAAQNWTAAGPAQILTHDYGAVTGRVTAIAVDPADASGNTVVLGTAGGGVWRSTNAAGAAPVFVPLTDDLLIFNDGEATASLAIGAVTVQPGGSGVILAGTGEAAPALDAHYGEGLLRSADSGQTWSLVPGSNDGVGGNHSFTGEGFAEFAWGTGGLSSTVVAAVGLPGGSAQVGAVTLGASVRGLYASEDAGQTWQLATIQDIAGDGSPQIVQGPQTDYSGYDGNSALAVAWDPLRQMFYAAVQQHGVYGSPDGLTWTRLSAQPGPGLATSAGLCPTDPGYAASPSCPLAQAALAVNPQTGDMFAWYVDADGNDQGMWQDVCSAQGGICSTSVTFATQIVTVTLQNGAGVIAGGVAGLTLLAVPSANNATTLLAGAQTLGVCTEQAGMPSSCAWQANCASGAMPGVRTLAGVSGAQTAFLGTQGGVWRSADAGGNCAATNFANGNAGLGPLAPLVSIASSSVYPGALLAGAGLLGSAGTDKAPAWSAAGGTAITFSQLQTGEGGEVALDSTSGTAYVTQGAGVRIARCKDGAGCKASDFLLVIGAAQVENDQALAQAPFELDPANGAQMLVGTCRVWRGPVDGAGWNSSNALSTMFDGNQQASCNGNTLVRSVAAGGPAAQNGSQVLYAGMQGLALNQFGVITPNAGHLFVTTTAQTDNGATPWTDLALSPVINAGINNGVFNASQFDVSAIFVDPHDPTGATVYATIAGLHVAHLYGSTDFGAHWYNLSANLPDVPANAVVVDPNDANTLYIALDTGVYFTRQIMQCAQQDCWQQFGGELPNTVVTALEADGGNVGLLRAATRGRGAWQIPLATGSLADETAVTVSPTSLSFAPQPVSTVSAAQDVTVTVTGTNALMTLQIVTKGDFVETDDCTGATIAAGGACTIQVSFGPTATGTRSGTLTIDGNLPGGQAGPFALSGTGLSAPQIVLSPSGTLNFGDVTVGQTSASQLVEVANTGQSTATLDSFNAVAPFALGANTCGATLAGQTGCTVALTYTPTARGQQTGTFTVTDSSGTQTLTLLGTGEAAASLSFSPQSLTFAATKIGQSSAIQTLTVTNSGDLSATVTGVSASGDFTVASNCAESVAGNSSCTLNVVFMPTQAGARTGTATLTTGFQTLTAQLSGTGVGTPVLTLTPSSLQFGGENLRQPSAPQTMTLTNTGTASDSITAITTQTATAGTQDYPVTSDCLTLAPGANCAIQVTFAPSVAGEDDGTLTVTASAPGTSVNAALYGSGNTFAWMAGQTPTASVPAGQTATYALQLQVVGYTGSVTTACAGLPGGASCGWAQPPVQANGSGIVSVMFTVATGPDVAAAAKTTRLGARLALAFCFGVFVMPLARRRRVLMMLALAVIAVGASSCGSAATAAPRQPTPPGTYMFTVTASGGGLTSSLPVQLIVE
jgi:hypothetical protein